jgi:hypothetical protein
MYILFHESFCPLLGELHSYIYVTVFHETFCIYLLYYTAIYVRVFHETCCPLVAKLYICILIYFTLFMKAMKRFFLNQETLP